MAGLDLTGFDYPEHLNAAVELTDRLVEQGFGDNVALIGNGRQRTYKELADWTNRIAHALVEDYGVRPGNRVLIRSANNPAMVAAWLAATKAGAVVVNTMPMLRAGELAKIVDKAEITLALCDTRLMDELVACAKDSRFLKKVIGFDGTANHDAELDRIALSKSVRFEAVRTGRDDVALLGFTSGTTGEPKATMHFHRDLLIIADGYAREVLGVTPDDVFVGSPPLAFTFGLGGLADLPAPLRRHRDAARDRLAAEHDRDHPDPPRHHLLHRPHRLPRDAEGDGRGRRPLLARAAPSPPARPCPARSTRNGSPRPASRCSTASAPPRCCTSSSPTASATASPPPPAARSPATAPRSSTRTMNEVPRGTPGRLAVQGPTGCRYLADHAPGELRPRRLEHHRRHLRRRTRTATSTSPPATTT